MPMLQKMDPEFHTAFWSPLACTGPELTIHWRDSVKNAVKTGDWAFLMRYIQKWR